MVPVVLLVGVLLEEETDVVGEFLTISQVFRVGGCWNSVGKAKNILCVFLIFIRNISLWREVSKDTIPDDR